MHQQAKQVDRLSTIDITQPTYRQAAKNNSKKEGEAEHPDFPLGLAVEVELGHEVVQTVRAAPIDLAHIILLCGTVLFFKGPLGCTECPYTWLKLALVARLQLKECKRVKKEGCAHVCKCVHDTGKLLKFSKATNSRESFIDGDPLTFAPSAWRLLLQVGIKGRVRVFVLSVQEHTLVFD